MALDDEAIQILGKTALLAGSFGLSEQAGSIAAALREVSPGNEDIKVLHATACLQANEFDKAKAILLGEVLAENPENTQAKSLLGVAYHFLQQPAERDKVLQEIIDAGDEADEDAIAIAKELMNS